MVIFVPFTDDVYFEHLIEVMLKFWILPLWIYSFPFSVYLHQRLLKTVRSKKQNKKNPKILWDHADTFRSNPV